LKKANFSKILPPLIKQAPFSANNALCALVGISWGAWWLKKSRLCLIIKALQKE
jgi:hypothetical protein